MTHDPVTLAVHGMWPRASADWMAYTSCLTEKIFWKKDSLKNVAFCPGRICYVEAVNPVSYTHLTLPTIYSV